MQLLGRRDGRLGWVKAPPVVESEIRAVWQEDEMPEEVTHSPGYQPFTLSPESQEWVDSMAEVVDGGKAVYGRPKPPTPTIHRSLATPPARPFPSTPHPDATSRPGPQILGIPHPVPPAPMPEIGGADVTAAARPPSMPEIAAAPVRKVPRRVLMPEIGEADTGGASPVLMPEIGE